MVIGDRVIVADIKEKQAAREIYEKAKSEGKKATLIEQQRPNVFTNAVANIGPHEKLSSRSSISRRCGLPMSVFRCVCRWSLHRATIRTLPHPLSSKSK